MPRYAGARNCRSTTWSRKASSASKYPATFRRPQGFRCSPSCAQVNASNSSSRVPKPPGRAMTPSDSSDIIIFRSCIESTTRSSVSPEWATSLAVRWPGMTPMICPPWARTASARIPIRPTCAPPKTTVCPRAASRAPSSRAADANSSPAPTLDPVKTQIRFMAALLQRYHATREGDAARPAPPPSGANGRRTRPPAHVPA